MLLGLLVRSYFGRIDERTDKAIREKVPQAASEKDPWRADGTYFGRGVGILERLFFYLVLTIGVPEAVGVWLWADAHGHRFDFVTRRIKGERLFGAFLIGTLGNILAGVVGTVAFWMLSSLRVCRLPNG